MAVARRYYPIHSTRPARSIRPTCPASHAYAAHSPARAHVLGKSSPPNLMDSIAEILKETSRENANIGNSPSAKVLQIASEASK